jgi:hypothetical protein
MSAPLSVEELRGRVAALTGPSREVDAEVCAALRFYPGSLTWVHKWAGEWRAINGLVHLLGDHGSGGNFTPAPVTSSVDAVLGLIERKLPGWAWYVSRGSGGGILPSSAMVWNIDGDGPEEQFAPTPALALLLALLASLQSQEP